MKNIILVFIVLAAFTVTSHTSNAAQVSKISKGRALVKGDSNEFEKGDEVYFIDSWGEKVGVGKVYKVRGRKYYVKKTEGQMKKGMKVDLADGSMGGSDNYSSSNSSGGSMFSGFFSGTESGLMAVGGIAMLNDYDETPFVFGGDYVFMRAQGQGWGYRAGMTYMSFTEENTIFFFNYQVDITIMEFGAAMEYIYPISKGLSLSGGARFGYALVDTEVSLAGLAAGGVDDNTMVLTPFVTALYSMGGSFDIGGEFRAPYFFNDGNFLGDYMFLGNLHYRF